MAENKIWRWYHRHKEAVNLMLEFARGAVPGAGVVIGGLQIILARRNDKKEMVEDEKQAEMEKFLEEIKPITSEVIEEIEENPEFAEIRNLPEEEMMMRGQKILTEDADVHEELEKIMPRLSQSLVMSIARLEKKTTTVIAGRYELLEQIGRGGQGEVWKAKHILAETTVAIKLLPVELSGDDNAIFAVREEYKRVTQLIHPHIVQYRDFEYDSESKRYFLAMDYIPGTTLRIKLMRLRSEPMLFSEAIAALKPIATALEFAHNQKIVHCDLKPENILVRESDEHWLLTDFGLAKEIRHSLSMRSMKVDISGTMPYMAPEQYKGRRATAETDIWALGIILYEMVAGYHPFHGTSFEHYKNLICNEEAERPENIPDNGWTILQKMLAKDKAERPSSFGDLQKIEIRSKDNIAAKATQKQETQQIAEEMQQIQEQNRQLQQQISREKEAIAHKKKEEEDKLKLEQELEKARQEQARLAAEKQALKKARQEQVRLAAEKHKINEQKKQASYPGFTYLYERTYSCNKQSYTVKEYRHERTGVEFVAIPAGEFMMGSDSGRDNEKPAHKVRLSGFLMAKTEVTQSVWQSVMNTIPWREKKEGVWQKIMNTNPWRVKEYVKEGENFAVSYVSWNDCQSFCEKTGLSLPTEAQWEYACRSGSSDTYYWGNSMDGDYAWYRGNANAKGEQYAHEVGQKKANAFGLHDMIGNVWESCADWYDSDYYKNSPTDNPNGASIGSERVCRGGCWVSDYSSSAHRSYAELDNSGSNSGFRLVYNFRNRQSN